MPGLDDLDWYSKESLIEELSLRGYTVVAGNISAVKEFLENNNIVFKIDTTTEQQNSWKRETHIVVLDI